LFANNDSEQVQFAVDEIQTSLNRRGQESVVRPVSQISQLIDDDYNIVLLNIGDKICPVFPLNIQSHKLNFMIVDFDSYWIGVNHHRPLLFRTNYCKIPQKPGKNLARKCECECESEDKNSEVLAFDSRNFVAPILV